MKLENISKEEMESLSPSEDGTYTKAMGGTELMNKALMERVDSDLLEEFHIIKSRVRKVDPDKKNVLWLHDLFQDPEAQHLKIPQLRDRFDKLVFVSNWQLSTYNLGLGVPYSKSIVLQNAIDPIEIENIDSKYRNTEEQIKLIYHTTPHRGLELLVPVMERLSEIHGDRIHLDVYSSFEAYGWPERDEPYKDIFKRIEEHSNMTYHGYQPNDVVRKALQDAHIFAYPNIWQETSCIAAIEAMSAGCEIVCSNLAALPETTGNFANMYQYNEDPQEHVHAFLNSLNTSIVSLMDKRGWKQKSFKAQVQKHWTDNFYNWDLRAAEWTQLLQGLSNGKA
jgi:UDP-glucose:(glucosyl)LPS alpha-1,2-glucosyltransferase